MAGAAETARLVAELTLKDKMSKGIDSAIGKVDKLGKKTGIAAQGIKTAGRNIERGLLIGAGAAAAGIALSVKAAGDFEAQLNTINTVAQLTGTSVSGDLGKIGDSIRQLSRDTGTATSDLTQAYYDLVSAGIDTADAQNVLTQANKLAIGGLSTTAEAVDLLTTAINSYGGDATQASSITNMFAEAIGAGKVTASEMAASFATVGPLAAEFGIGIDEISAALGLMTAKGTPAAQAFTQMRSAIVALKKPNSALAAFQKDLGKNFAKMAQRKGLAYAYNELTIAAKKAGIPVEKLTGRIEGALFASQVTGDSFADYNAELEKVRKSSEGAGVAQEQMDKRTTGFNYAMEKLKANVHDAAITIGSELLPPLADLAGEFSTFISEHQGDVKEFAKNLAGAFRGAIDWAKRLDFEAIGKALEAAAGFARGLIDAFLRMPPEVQGTLLALAGLDKLSGGAISGIVGELGKGLIKGVLGITAAVVNVNGGVVNGGGGIPGKAIPAAAAGVGWKDGLAALGGLAGFTAIAGAAALGLYYGIPALMGSKPAGRQSDTRTITTPGGGTITGANAGIVRLFTPALKSMEAAADRLNPPGGGPGTRDQQLLKRMEAAADRLNPPGGGPGTRDQQLIESKRIASLASDTKSETIAVKRGIAEVKAAQGETNRKQAAAIVAFRAGERATEAGASRTVSAIQANRPIINNYVGVSVSATSITKVNVTQDRVGPGTGSAGGKNTSHRKP